MKELFGKEFHVKIKLAWKIGLFTSFERSPRLIIKIFRAILFSKVIKKLKNRRRDFTSTMICPPIKFGTDSWGVFQAFPLASWPCYCLPSQKILGRPRVAKSAWLLTRLPGLPYVSLSRVRKWGALSATNALFLQVKQKVKYLKNIHAKCCKKSHQLKVVNLWHQ